MPVKGLQNIEIRGYYTVRTMPLNERLYLHSYRIFFFSRYIVIKLDDIVYTKPVEDFPAVEIVRNATELVADSYTLIFHKNESQFHFVFTNDECLNELEAFEENYLWFLVEYPSQLTTTDTSAGAVDGPCNDSIDSTSIIETITDVLARKQDELQRLVDNQDYLGAATLRDEITLLEKELKNNPSP